ncbi:MAG: DNA polymerase IV [Pseudomonadota bacterium]
MSSLCRDCDNWSDTLRQRCNACGSARLVTHRDLGALTIAHIDCDAFYAAIEKRDNPELRDKPVLVGGGKRGVVSTCCYIARLHGVRSAMPMFKALKACPEAVVVRPRYDAYVAASRQIRQMLQQLTPLVQMISIDEGYLDLSGTARVLQARPAEALSRLARQVEEEIGITISIGLSENKFLAKTASELDKPRGFAALSLADAPDFLAPRPVGFLHGVGPQLAKKLERAGYARIGALQTAETRDLIGQFGETGLWLAQRAHGIDNRAVHATSERKSVSAERTFETDIGDLTHLEDRLWQVCEETAARAKQNGVEGATITLKLKSADFKSITRSVTLPNPTQLAQTLFRAARPVLAREVDGSRKFRLIGIGISHLQDAKGDTKDLIDPKIEKRAAAERASDLAKSKFGKGAVVSGRAIRLAQQRKDKSK